MPREILVLLCSVAILFLLLQVFIKSSVNASEGVGISYGVCNGTADAWTEELKKLAILDLFSSKQLDFTAEF